MFIFGVREMLGQLFSHRETIFSESWKNCYWFLSLNKGNANCTVQELQSYSSTMLNTQLFAQLSSFTSLQKLIKGNIIHIIANVRMKCYVNEFCLFNCYRLILKPFGN